LVAHLNVADLGGGLRKERADSLQEARFLDLAVRREGADVDAVSLAPDVIEASNPAQVDQKLRPGESQLHERHKALTAGQELRSLAVPCEK
jgi:hypothetical protein